MKMHILERTGGGKSFLIRTWWFILPQGTLSYTSQMEELKIPDIGLHIVISPTVI
jgi:hypothetical protein